MTGFNAFLWSLTQQESGGNYRAVGVWVGGDRAYGRYQVMGANIPSWTAKHYGRRLTPQQFLHNNAAQDAVVRGVLGGYYRRYGARGAASMWYSGQPNWRKTYGNPPVYRYVNSVMSRAQRYNGQRVAGGGGGGSRGGGGGGGSWSPEAVTPKLSEKELAERYGLTSSLINSSGELKKLFNKAVSGQWTADRFQASLRNTRWWKNQSKDLREYIVQKHSDPATHKAGWQATRYTANRLAVEAGWGDQINKKGRSTDLLQEITYKMMALGWSEARAKDWLAARLPISGPNAVVGGEVGEVFDQLHQIAYMNGMRYGDWYGRTAKKIASGQDSLQRAEGQIRKAAAAKYSAWAEQIRAGQNVMDLASPYIQSMSQLLELPTGEVDLFSKHMDAAMAGDEPMALWEFERKVRNDPRWRKTNNAREGLMSVAHQVARDFGVAS